jgi:hypothetical protein
VSRAEFVSRLAWLTAFGVAFGYLEGAVVVYLRAIYYPDGFAFPLAVLSDRLLGIELGRELATLVMLWAVAMLRGRSGWDRFGAFAFLFGVWDIVFYATLWLLLDWPDSLLTWDVLFLVPLVWTGPVITALLVAGCLVAAGALLIQRAGEGVQPFQPWWVWGGAAAALGLLLYSFMANHGVVQANGVPDTFPWVPYVIGLLLGWGVFGLSFWGPQYNHATDDPRNQRRR